MGGGCEGVLGGGGVVGVHIVPCVGIHELKKK